MPGRPNTLTRRTWFDVDRAFNAHVYPRSDSLPSFRLLVRLFDRGWKVRGIGLIRRAEELGISPSRLKKELVRDQLKASFAAMRIVLVDRPSVGTGERRTTRKIVPEALLIGPRPRNLSADTIWLWARWFEPDGLDNTVGDFMRLLERHVYRELDKQILVLNRDAMLRVRQGCDVEWLGATTEDDHKRAVRDRVESVLESLDLSARECTRPASRRARRHASIALRGYLSGQRRELDRAAIAVARRLVRRHHD